MNGTVDAIGPLGEGLVFAMASHRNPPQIVRLVRRLKADLPAARIVIHHDDSKSTLPEAMLAGGATLLPGAVRAAWGEASQAEIATRLLRYVDRTLPYAYVVFLSGQDYPLVHLRALPAYINDSDDGILQVESSAHAEPLRYELTWFRLPSWLQFRAMHGLFERLIYHLNDRQRNVRFANGRIGCWIGMRMPTPLPPGWRMLQGSTWWVLGRRAVAAYLHVVEQQPRMYRWFMKRTIMPDEGIFQTFLLNDPTLRLHDRDVRHVRWDDRRSGSPATFVSSDLDELTRSGCFFARKFDTDVDVAILDALDRTA